MQNTVIGVYDKYSQAQAAVNELMTRGLSRAHINMIPQEESFDSRSSALRSSDDRDEGWSIGKFFRSMFGSDEPESSHTDLYHEAVRRGSYLVTVEAESDEQRDQACEILDRYDPINIDERSSAWRTQGWSGYDRNAAAMTDEQVQADRSLYPAAGISGTASTAAAAKPGDSAARAAGKSTGGTLEGTTRLPVVEEEMQVGKRVVQRGGVRIYQRMTERPVEETVRLREEKVQVERHPVNKEASQADLAAFKEGSMELRESSEEPIVSKTARVVEEVVVGKQVRERDEKVQGNVRRTDVEVENLGADAGNRGMADSGFDRDYYRNHWQTSFANQGGRYEDYEPAYRFGSDLHSNNSYRGRNWNEVEPEARRDWESGNAGSPWEKAKDAVRHAWERTTR